MMLLKASRFKILINQVFWITIAWTIVGAFDALNTFAITNSDFVVGVIDFNFFGYFWVTTLGAMVAGLVSGSILIFYLRERLRTKSFGVALLVNSMVISALNFFISAIALNFFFKLQFVKGPINSEAIEVTTALIQRTYYFKSLVLWMFVVVLTIIGLHINEKYGPGVLRKLLMGQYHHPREEERIFMFVDIRSSTTIAEQLGHIRFFNLLNDFFRHITPSVISTSGEIYQYVGDEVVISWSMDKGTQQANCIRCFYEMQEAIQKKSNRYQEKYSLVPEFKAGLHCGVVTTGEIGVIKKDIVFSGDVMNTTSRIQNLCNTYGVNILLSKYLIDKLNLPPHDYNPKRVGIIALKGKKQKVELYTFEEDFLVYEARPLTASLD